MEDQNIELRDEQEVAEGHDMKNAEAQSVAESIKKAVVLLGGNENLNPNDMFD